MPGHMPIETRCICGKMLTVSVKLAGSLGSCPYCGATVRYPKPPPPDSNTSRIVITVG